MSQSPIELKGSSFTLSVIHLHSSEPDIIRRALEKKISQAPSFLRNAPVVINVAMLNHNIDWNALKEMIATTGLQIVGISGCQDEQQRQIIAQIGLPLLTEGKVQKKEKTLLSATSSPSPSDLFQKTRIINTPIRSGQQIYARNSDLIVTNSVSAGAELIADGNIHIYGTMRGRALAGACGDNCCQIFCTQLGAELVSIAGQYWLSDQIPPEFLGKSARLSLSNNILRIQPLD